MNIKRVINYIGVMLILEAILMLLPFLCSLFYSEVSGRYFIYVLVPVLIVGIVLRLFFTSDERFFAAEGFATASLGWIVLSIIGAIPFYISGEIPNYIDALFETVSGFTTTGATILNDVTSLSKCMNFWRCFTHFIGGMGILVLVIAIIPTKSVNMQIMKAEAPGPQVGRLVPKVSDTAKTLYIIYTIITIIAIISYKISGMPLYDSICIGLGTAGTGGFVVTKNGCADYNEISQLLIAIFMLIFGVNFNLYFLIFKRKIKDALFSEELRVYFLIVLIATFLMTFNTLPIYGKLENCLLHSFFQVSSIITTTGFATKDYVLWPVLSRNILVLLMIIGGMAGSTAGGFKIARLIIIIKSAINEMYLQLHQNSVKVVKFEGKVLSNSLIRTANSYTIIYILFIAFGILFISFENFDFRTTFSSVIETFNNVGLGLSLIGPKGNFSIFNQFSKIIFIILMLTGRLEIFPIIMLFSKKTWRREQ